jgi:hypothetical protein
MRSNLVKDGGGIRGYSSLIILDRLMTEVHKVETRGLHEHEKRRHSSYHPEEYIPCIDNATAAGEDETSDERDCVERRRYLPCHYFDYIGGTSTGG